MNESTKSNRSSGFTLFELLIVIFSLGGFIGGVGEGWKYGLGWSLLYGLIGTVYGLGIIVVPIFAFAALVAGYDALRGGSGEPNEARGTIDASGDSKDDGNLDG